MTVSVPGLPTFKNPQLLVTALTHRSALNENLTSATESNERLEFLGDAVLELSTTLFLYDKLPNEPEGTLTAFRSALVKTGTLAELAKELKLDEHLFMSKGEEHTGGRSNDSLLANTTEAVLGALYLDQGFDAVDAFLRKHLFIKFSEIKENNLHRDSKSLLQERVQAKSLPTPSYKVTKESGPDHDKTFTVVVSVRGKEVGVGAGKSKQLAQQEAAREALEKYYKE